MNWSRQIGVKIGIQVNAWEATGSFLAAFHANARERKGTAVAFQTQIFRAKTRNGRLFMATSPFTASSRAVMNVPVERNANLNSSEIKQELAELDRAKTKAEDALRLWLRWNAIHEKLSTAMFDQRHDQQKVEQLMDESDSLRRQAIQAALECLLGT